MGISDEEGGTKLTTSIGASLTLGYRENEESNRVKEESNRVKEESNRVKEESNRVKEESNRVKEESNKSIRNGKLN